jgi:hypothetical protein
MALALSAATEQFRSFVNEPVTALMTDTQAKVWINDGSREVARRTECLEDTRSFSSVGYQRYYSHGTYFLRLKDMCFDQLHTIWPLDGREWEMETRYSPNSLGRPQRVKDWEDKYEIWPRPSSSADTTTLSSAMATGATSITMAAGTGFDKMGRVKIGSEIIGYNHLTGSIIEGCQRGMEGTTDTSHGVGSTVTKRDFVENIYAIPQTMVTDAQVSSMPKDAWKAIFLWSQEQWYIKNKEFERVAEIDGLFEKECARLKTDLRKKQRVLNRTIKAADRFIGRL